MTAAVQSMIATDVSDLYIDVIDRFFDSVDVVKGVAAVGLNGPMNRGRALDRAQCFDPDRCIDEDHKRGRRRDLGRSISSFTCPIIAFNSSIRLRRTISFSESTTVSVLDSVPRSMRASSRSGSGCRVLYAR